MNIVNRIISLNRKAHLLAFICSVISLFSFAGEGNQAKTAVSALANELVVMEEMIRESTFFDSELDRSRAYMHLVRTLIASLEIEVLQDKDFPYLRSTDFWLREGADNPDQRYSYTPVHGGESYRIWGNLGSAYRLEIDLSAGEPWAGTGHAAGYLSYEKIDFNDDGSFEIFLSKEPHQGNWLRNPDDATTVMIRQVYNNWNTGYAGEIHVDRVGYEGAQASALTVTDITNRLQAATAMFRKRATVWPSMVKQIITDVIPANQVPALKDRVAIGGVPGRLMAMGHFDLQQGEVLLIKAPSAEAVYQGIQLSDRWFASLEYANLISSLNTTQAQLAPDGNYYYVIASEDPGYVNWLETGGLGRGVFVMRYDGVPLSLNKPLQPSATKVLLSELSDLIPGFFRVTDVERKRQRAARRKHIQIRANR